MTAGRLVRRIILWTVLPLLLVIGGGIGYVILNPGLAGSAAARIVALAFPGHSFSAGETLPLFWPTPGVHFKDFRLDFQNGRVLKVAQADVRFDLGKLIGGDILPTSATLKGLDLTYETRHGAISVCQAAHTALRLSRKRTQEGDILSGDLAACGWICFDRLTVPELAWREAYAAPFDLRVPFAMTKGRDLWHPRRVTMKNASLVLGKDSLSMDGIWQDGRLSGHLDIRELSLPQWFAFGRDLPNGLQNALHNISGSMDFLLTPKTVTASKLAVSVNGISLSGYGRVADFSKPVIDIDVRAVNSSEANLNETLPELLGKEPQPPQYPGPAIRFGPDGGDSLTCDIRIAIPQAEIWELHVGGLAVRIAPGKERMALDAAATSFYEGKFRVGMEFTPRTRISCSIEDAALRPLMADIGTPCPFDGRLSMREESSGSMKSVRHYLSSMESAVSMAVHDVHFTDNPENRFRSVTFDFRGKGTRISENSQWEGTWRTVWTPYDAAKGPLGRMECDAAGRMDISPETGLPKWSSHIPQLIAAPFSLTDLGQREPKGAQGCPGHAPVAGRPIPTDWMRSADLKGTLRLQRFMLGGLPMTDTVIPFTVGNGKALLKDCTGILLGGTQRMTLDMAAKDPAGIATEVRYVLRDADMGRLTGAFSKDIRIHSRVSLVTKARGVLRHPENILHALEGKWRLHLGKGRYETLKDRRPSTSRKLDAARAEGRMKNGLIVCDTLTIKGPGLTVTGSGDMNLPKSVLDYRLTASMPGLPDIPVSFSGPISDPKAEANIVGAFINAISKTGAKVLAPIGDLLTAPFRLFR